MLAGIAVAALQLSNPPDLMWTLAGWNKDLSDGHLKELTKAVGSAFAPIPQIIPGFWNTQYVDFKEGLGQQFAAILFLASLLFFLESSEAMFYYLAFTASILAIVFFKWPGSMRHYGLIFTAFIFALWVARSSTSAPILKGWLANSVFSRKNLSILLACLLILQVAGACVAAYYDYNNKFSAGKDAAQYLIDNNLTGNDTLVVAIPSSSITSVAPYLPSWFKVYQIEYPRFGTYVTWNSQYYDGMVRASRDAIPRIDAQRARGNYSRTIILLMWWESSPEADARTTKLAEFPALNWDEQVFVYEYHNPIPEGESGRT
jgi:hypothetical protein